MKALLKRVIDGALRRLGLVRMTVAAAQTVDAIYLSHLGRAPDGQERAESVGALYSGALSVPALIETLSASAEGEAHLIDTALPVFASEGYVAPQAHFEQLVQIGFRAVLGRPTEGEALSSYEGALRSGALSIDAFIDELSGTQEAANRIVTQGYVAPQAHFEQLVQIGFQAILGRPPESEALSAYEGALRSGVLSVDAFVDELSGTLEAANRIVTHGYVNRRDQLRGLIDAVFETALGRAADEDALQSFVHLIESGDLTLDAAINELSTCPEAQLKALELVKPILKDHGFLSEEDHYSVVADAIFRSILGRPLEDPTRAFASNFIAGQLTLETAIENLLNSEEVRLRIRHVGLPDVLEGIYRALMGAPESDPAMRSLIRSAASQRLFETIKTMTLSAEAHHYLMQPIIKAHRQQFLTAARV